MSGIGGKIWWLAGAAAALAAAAALTALRGGPAERAPMRRAGDVRRIALPRGGAMEVVWVEGGEFETGMSPLEVEEAVDEAWEWSGEREGLEERLRKGYPRRRAEMRTGFWMGRREVTRGEWAEVTGEAVEEEKAELPQAMVSWERCQEWIRWLNEGLAAGGEGARARLPTEAEWEYAARGGAKGAGFRYSGGDELREVGWYAKNADGAAHRGGELRGNELGLQDMSGNLSEWCADTPVDPETGETMRADLRVLRGGSWKDPSLKCHVAVRDWLAEDARRAWVGIRLVFEEGEAGSD